MDVDGAGGIAEDSRPLIWKRLSWEGIKRKASSHVWNNDQTRIRQWSARLHAMTAVIGSRQVARSATHAV